MDTLKSKLTLFKVCIPFFKIDEISGVISEFFSKKLTNKEIRLNIGLTSLNFVRQICKTFQIARSILHIITALATKG
jgi:hypothetical protein